MEKKDGNIILYGVNGHIMGKRSENRRDFFIFRLTVLGKKNLFLSFG
jgi:hypothetical protein